MCGNGDSLFALLFAGTLFAVSCNGEQTETPAQPSATTTIPSPARLRVAQLSEDAGTYVDLAVNGEIRFRGLEFGSVSEYLTLAAGSYRLQFVPTGTLSPAVAETTVSLQAGDTVTVAFAGFDSSDLLVLLDERAVSSTRARLRFVNTVPDFPAPLDLAVFRGPVIASRIGYLGSSSYQELIPGLYDFDLLRTGSADSAAESFGHALTTGSNYTAFAIGALRREDIELLVVQDANP